MKPQEKPIISPLAVRADDAAKMLGIGRTSLHYLMKSGKIPYTKVNRAVLFRISDLDDFLKTPPRINEGLESPDVVLNTLKRMPNNG
jgi:excisionase family DNA binding protein